MPLGFVPKLKLSALARIALAPGDIFGLITDGVFEYENPAAEAFGHERVGELVRRHQREPLARLAAIVVEEVERFGQSAPQLDDMTMLLIRRLDS